MVDVIVAVRNETRMIAGKLSELDAIEYPADRLRFVIVDGGSSDGTIAAITAHAASDARWQALLTNLASKTAQLNEGLARSEAPWVLVTDADARVPADTLARLVDEAVRYPRLGVVGTTIVPHQAHPLDAWHWRISNWIRCVERRVGGASGLVGAPCYLFRRDILDRFPEDAVADDVHVVCRAAGLGARTGIVVGDVRELRVAGTTRDWFCHKVRRTLGYLREVFRFAPELLRTAAPMRTVLLWRALALTMAPAAGLVAGVLLISVVGLPWVAGLIVVLAAAGGIRSAPATRRGGLQEAAAAAALPLWLLLITLTALVLYPFVRQSASYSRFAWDAGKSDACS